MKRFALALPLLLAALPAEAEAPVRLELNRLAQQEAACRLTFTAESAPGLAALLAQVVVIDRAGEVRQFTLFDFGAVPPGGLRVREFDLAELPCAEIALVLFNGVERCETTEGTACTAAPAVASRIESVEVQG